MTSTTHDKEWIIEDKIISMMALCDNEKRLLGMDTDLGHQDVMRKAIRNELDQIRREAVEDFIQLNEKGVLNSRLTTVYEDYFWKQKTGKSRLALLLLEAKKELLDEIEKDYHWHIETPLAPEGENEYTLMIDEDDWEKLRAKTLGEK